MKITLATKDDFNAIAALWQRSVEATHHFLPQSDIASLYPLILDDYLPVVTVYKATLNNQLQGFVGVVENRVEMLFIEPAARGTGVGKALLQFAIKELGIDALDVNEQNPQAIGFYQHMGFVVESRSELDGQGNPYPLLHLRLNNR